jgi:protease-4
VAKKSGNPLIVLFVISIVASLFLIAFSVIGPRLPGKKRAETLSLVDRIGARIGVINIQGVILESMNILEDLKDFDEDPRIKGLIVRIDSPGGAVGSSQEIYDELRKWRERGKPVVASLGSVAASGGYYIAAAAQQIVSTPGTLTASIGVIMQMTYLEDLFKWLKVQPFVIKGGKFKDIGNPGRKMLPEERELLQQMIDNTHLQFQKAVADGRGLPLEFVQTVADGRIMTGEQARNAKLVDQLGNFDDAVDLIARLADISKPQLVYPHNDRFRGLRELLSGKVGITDRILLMLQQQRLLPLSTQRYGALYLWQATP